MMTLSAMNNVRAGNLLRTAYKFKCCQGTITGVDSVIVTVEGDAEEKFP